MTGAALNLNGTAQGSPPDAREIRALVEAGRVHRRVYTDPILFDLELARIFGRVWLYIAHASQIKEPGDFIRTWLAGLDVIVTRGVDGTVHVLHNRCAHRGVRFCTADFGNARLFMCPYHGWTYRLDGSLDSVPHRQSYPESFRLGAHENALFQVPRVEEYRGFIFANLAPFGPSLRDHLGMMTDAIDNLLDRAPAGEVEICATPFRVEFRANWKMHQENVVDIFHPSFVHASSVAAARAAPAGASRLDEDQTREQLKANAHSRDEWENVELVALSGGHNYVGGFYRSGVLASNVRNDSVSQRYRAALVATRGEAKADAALALNRFNNLIYPNMILNAQQHQLRIVQPLAVDRTVISAYCFRLIGAPDEIYHRAVRYLTNLNSPASMISSDDLAIFTRCQLGLKEAGADWVDVRRGVGAERAHESGATSGYGTELPNRAQFAAWLHHMTTP